VKVAGKKLANCAACLSLGHPSWVPERDENIVFSMTNKEIFSQSKCLPCSSFRSTLSSSSACISGHAAPYAKENQGICSFAPNANADQAMVANSNKKKITGVESMVDSNSLERSDPK
jgi:hypothetical protein